MDESLSAPTRAGPSRGAVTAWAIAATAFFVLAVLWTASKLGYTGDTWIGLAAGERICERGYFDFPIEDVWTFTFAGKPWWNQNWLTHVIYYLLVQYASDLALVWLKVLLTALTGLLLWRSCELLSGDRVLSLLIASTGLLVLSEYTDIRPNHVGMVCAGALFWMLMRLKRGGGWTVWAIPALMLFWGNSHGSFLLGYVLVFMFISTEGLQRVFSRGRADTPRRNLVRLTATTLLSAAMLAVVSPYGLENFRHPLLVMVSEDKATFQRVTEWLPSWIEPAAWLRGAASESPFWFPLRPWVGGYWALVMLSLAIFAAAGLRRLFRQPAAPVEHPGPPEPRAFDLTEWAFVVIAMYFSLSSRRFVPLFVLFVLPVTTKLLRIALGSARSGGATRGIELPGRRPGTMTAATAVSVLASVFLAAGGLYDSADGGRFKFDIWRAYVPAADSRDGASLLARHAGPNADVLDLAAFARKIGLAGNAFNEWTWGGYLMFAAPDVKLFIDGRSQALFPAEHVDLYGSFMGEQAASETASVDSRLRLLDVDIVMLRRRPWDFERMLNPLLATGRWEPVFESEHTAGAMLLVRAGSDNARIEDILRRYYAGELDWPDTRLGWRIRGYALQRGPNPDWRGSLDALKQSLRLGPDAWVYENLVRRAFDELNDREGAIRFFSDELARLTAMDPHKLDAAESEQLLNAVTAVRRVLSDLQSGTGVHGKR